MDIKLAVTCPVYDSVHPGTVVSLDGFRKYWAEEVTNKGGKKEFQFFQLRGTLLPDVRHACVREALQWGATHMLFIDADMFIPSDVPLRLLNSMLQLQSGVVEDVDREAAVRCAAVGANYPRRVWPTQPTAEYELRVPCFTVKEKVMAGENLLESVRHVGGGCMLIDMRAFALLEMPYFMYEPMPDGGFRGEDVYFCLKLLNQDLTIWVDHLASLGVKHVGEMYFTNEMAWECRDKIPSYNKEDSAA